MLALMEAKRVRLVSIVDAEIREALKVEAAIMGREMSEIVEELLREALAERLEQMRQARAGKGKGKRP